MTQAQTFLITLTQDVIVSASSATAGQHQSLDYLPGSLFLGLAASRGYAELTSAEAWAVFHSGNVRFLDALPLIDAQPSYPVPLSLHTYKGERAREAQSPRLDANKVFDPALLETDSSRQPKQLRKGYITETGFWHLPVFSHRMKTAIEPDSGRAAHSQLFGYQALQAGQQFLFTLQADDSATALFKRCVHWLTGPAQIGRSRSAQYGGITLEPIKRQQPLSLIEATTTTPLTLWLQSDLALLDHQGQACLTPTPELFGLPEGSRWLAEQSYLRTRRYSQYNAKRRCFDSEREVICRGSILRFELSQSLSTQALANLQRIGLYQESGLGQIAVNPKILNAAHPLFTQPSRPTKVKHTPLATPNTPLITLLHQRADGIDQHKQITECALRLFETLIEALLEARQWLGLPENQPLPSSPGRSQWGQIKALSSDHRSRPDTLWTLLFEADNAVIRARSGWDLSVGPTTTLADYLRTLCDRESLAKNPQLGDIMGQLATLGLSPRWQQQIDGTVKPMQETRP